MNFKIGGKPTNQPHCSQGLGSNFIKKKKALEARLTKKPWGEAF